MPCENGDTAENLRMLSKTVRQSICCTIVCLCIPVSRFAVHIILDIVTYICKYIYIYAYTWTIYALCVCFSRWGCFYEEGREETKTWVWTCIVSTHAPLCLFAKESYACYVQVVFDVPNVGHWTEVKPALTVFQPSEENKTKLPSNKLGHAGPSRVTTHVLPTTARGTHDTLKLYSRFSWLGDIVLSWISK